MIIGVLLLGLVAADYPVRPVPFTSVHLRDSFWAPRLEINRTVTIPHVFRECELTGRMDNFARAAQRLRGEVPSNLKPPGLPFDDTDLYKAIEAASYSLAVRRDAELDAYVDRQIALIASAQEPDGYLYTARTIDPAHPHPWSGKERWVDEAEFSHELYCLGHLYEAAAAHFQATGKHSLLDVAVKSADLLVATFGPGKKSVAPGHQIVEMGLAKLYRVTGKRAYLDLAKFFLDCRGDGSDYSQNHIPVARQREAVGHAVRAGYMYSGMADVAALDGDADYRRAIDAIWQDVVSKKLYITGGIGATSSGEAFGRPYQLPNMSAYCETCAAIGNSYWNDRLFLLHPDGKYIDVLERTLYNGMLSGVSTDGKAFFYPNPLESIGQHQRSPWFGCACCPTNVTRFIASVPGYFYAQRGPTVFVNLYASSAADLKLDSGPQLQIQQDTEYPWNGDVRLVVNPSKAARFTLDLRIPGWARNEAVPSDLYRFVGRAEAPTLSVNGRSFPVKPVDGYVSLERTWRKGDIVRLHLPMPARRVLANEKVLADRGRVAVQRGPILYCAEGADNDGSVRNLLLPDSAALTPQRRPDLLGGVTILRTTAASLAAAEGAVRRTSKPVTLVPYFAWCNRGRNEMEVWLPDRIESARPTRPATLSTRSKITTSGGSTPMAINDGLEPEYAGDDSNPFFHWWPKKGTDEWVEMTFPQEAVVSEATVYWFDDTGRGECRVPASWRLLYRDGADWKPVEGSAYGVLKDQPNRIVFKPVKTRALRLEVRLQSNWSAGLWEWKVR